MYHGLGAQGNVNESPKAPQKGLLFLVQGPGKTETFR